jgi:pimeloyl-ACP methyl ester carboxylesterase
MDPEKNASIRVADSELYYEIYGSGRPLILIHGGWADRRTWEPQIEALSQDYQVIVYDLRGHGRSTVGELPYSHVDDLTTLMDRLDLETAVLIGHELGAAVARAAAIEKYDRVQALVLAAAGTQGLFGIPMSESEMEILGRPLAAAREGNIPGAIDEHEAVWIHGVNHKAANDVRDAIRAILETHSFAEYRPGAPEIMWSTHKISEMHLIQQPTVLIWGENDQPLIERTAVKTADFLPDGYTAPISDAAHYLHWEQPQEFNLILLDFLAGLDD